MQLILERMAHVVQNPSAFLDAVKKQCQKKMIGYFFPAFPEELLYAGGIYPVQLYPSLQDAPTRADDHLQTFLCGYLRSQWDQILRGQHSYLDGAILPRSCEAVTFLYQTWKRHNPFDYIDYVNIPWKRTRNTIAFFAQELERIQKNIASLTGRDITPDDLTSAVSLYNRNREMLKNADRLRRTGNLPFSDKDFFHMVMSRFVLDVEEHTKMMVKLLDGTIRSVSEPTEPKILLSGGCVIDPRVYDIINAAGARVAADDTHNGGRSFHGVVAENRDPLWALSERCLSVPCGFNTSIEDRFSFIENRIIDARIEGVIFAINRNCETEKFDYPILKQKIEKRCNIPSILIETDILCSQGPLKTRIEAFVEMIQQGNCQ